MVKRYKPHIPPHQKDYSTLTELEKATLGDIAYEEAERLLGRLGGYTPQARVAVAQALEKIARQKLPQREPTQEATFDEPVEPTPQAQPKSAGSKLFGNGGE